MALTIYETYLNSLAKAPVEEWRENTQQMIYDTWLDTSTVETVSGQKGLGERTFSDESVQLNSVIDPKTGKSLGDDYRKIIYQVLADNLITNNLDTTTRFMGKYYQFSGFTWLTVNTNTVIGANASAILQKCNNWLKWYDKSGILHQWECVFERTLSSTNFDLGSEGVAEISADTLIKVQRNVETDAISYNQRFIFDGRAFQVKQINNHISKSYMELYLFETQIQSNDDLINNIANSTGQAQVDTNETKILPEESSLYQGEEKTFSVYKYVGGTASSDTFSITANGPALGLNYELNIIDGNNFSIKNLLQSDIPLEIICTNNNDAVDIAIMHILLDGGW